MRDERWIFWIGCALGIALVFYIGHALALDAPVSDRKMTPCETTLTNLSALATITDAAIAKAGEKRMRTSTSVRRIALLRAAETLGFYRASALVLPLVCSKEELPQATAITESMITTLQTYIDKSW